jgi:hypothetical protein
MLSHGDAATSGIRIHDTSPRAKGGRRGSQAIEGIHQNQHLKLHFPSYFKSET